MDRGPETFHEALKKCMQHHDCEAFLDLVREKVVKPCVKNKFFLLNRALPEYHFKTRPTGDVFEKVCDELLATLIIKLSHKSFLDRFQLEDNVNNIHSFLIQICENLLKTDRQNYMFKRFANLFDAYPREYGFWLSPVKKLIAPSADIKHSQRNYCLKKWPTIPDLFPEFLTAVLGATGFRNWGFIKEDELKRLADEGFERSQSSLKIAHFMEFLRAIGFFGEEVPDNDPISIAPNPASDDDTSGWAGSSGPMNLEDKLLYEDFQVFCHDFLPVIPKKYLESFFFFSRAFFSLQQKALDKVQDYCRKAAELCDNRISPNTIRGHVLKNRDSVAHLFENQFRNEFEGLKDIQMLWCFTILMSLVVNYYWDDFQ
ncbi:MAG: hypothetical protein Q9P90_08180 [candidate division KSB1 bacterium]|nr:hypothetical protein [candidate division KSB1 bacterium]